MQAVLLAGTCANVGAERTNGGSSHCKRDFIGLIDATFFLTPLAVTTISSARIKPMSRTGVPEEHFGTLTLTVTALELLSPRDAVDIELSGTG